MINGIVAGQDQYTLLQFSRSRKFSDITVSADGMTATIPSTGTHKAILGNVGKSTGKHQFEIACGTVGGETTFGIASADASALYDYRVGFGAGSLQSAGVFRAGGLYSNLATGTATDGSAGITSGVVIGVTIDLTDPALPSIGVYRNGSLIATKIAGPSAAWYPAFSAGYNTIVADAVATIRGSGLAHPVSGFTEWNAS